MRQKEAMENSSTPVSSTSRLAGQLRCANSVRRYVELTVGFRNFENESFGRPRKVELFYDGKTFNSEKILEPWQGLCLMERGKMWFWRFQIGTFKSVNDWRSTNPISGTCRGIAACQEILECGAEIRMRPIKCECTHTHGHTLLFYRYRSIVSPGVTPPPPRQTMGDLTALFHPGAGIWPWGGFRGWGTLTVVRSVLWSACVPLNNSMNQVVQTCRRSLPLGGSVWPFSLSPGWGFRIDLTPPWSNPHHLLAGRVPWDMQLTVH